MDIKKLIDICVKIWPPKVTVVVNLFGEVNMPKDEPKAPAMNYGSINVYSADECYDEFLKQQERRRADDD